MATIDQQFVEYIVKTLVNNPDKVSVERKIDEKGVLLSLTVDPEDVGRVIGKRGVTAQSIRMLLRALGTKQDARYNLKIVNTDEDGESSHESHRDEKRQNQHEEEKEVEAVEVEDVEEDGGSDEEYDDESETSELAEKTRAELADLDDLDI
ncbi:KH domain-containing protein [Candidatus Saccharibacteria bacterium]|nr:KH domain-containing protein [Candidatus Saccharibacteria bacterium]